MPSRLLREGILDSDLVNSISFMAELFYRRLMSVADDFGLCDGRAEWLRTKVYPLKSDQVSVAEVSGYLQECLDVGLLFRYECDEKPYLQIVNFGQRIYPASKPKFPEPKENCNVSHYAGTRRKLPQPAAGCRNPPQPAASSENGENCNVSHYAARARTRTKTKTETETKLETETETNANTELRVIARGRFPDPNTGEESPAYWSERLYDNHPKKKNLPLVQRYCVDAFSHSPPAEVISDFRHIAQVHAEWCETDDWTKDNARYCPPLDQWLVDRGYERRPIREPTGSSASGRIGGEAFTIAARMLAENKTRKTGGL